ncbi:TIGR03016 family PEP-CTERM system-associated outer membrane protein [uncultured Aquabacterium sp.]|uniref:TIGR03016 family PEP-CTERM system-associated outer membrane protein n=1 Tax=Aquabacterium sp. TaxID=1872578 RepID=UPI0030CF083B
MHMATTLRDARCTAARLACGVIVLAHGAHAQGQTQTQTPAVAAAQPSQGAAPLFTPTLRAQISHSDNATQTTSSRRQSDTIVSISPGVSLAYRGANSTVTGQMQLSSVNYLGNTQADRLLPNGRLALHTEVARQGWGLDASVAADQVKSQFTSAPSASVSTADTYTNTRVQVSPFLERALDAQTLLRARLERTQLHSTANSDGLSNRPNTHTNGASLNISRRPSRAGYALSARYQDTQADGQAQSIYVQRLVKGTALYALSPELEVGLVLGRESNQALLQQFRDTVKGAQLDWRPSQRTQVKALVEERFFGRSWEAEASHRTPMLSLGLSSNRQISTYTSPVGNGLVTGGSTQALLDALLSSRIPDEAERSKAVNDMITQRNLPRQLGSTRDLYDLNAQVRQATVARAALMGTRSVLLVSAGQTMSRPLAGDAFSSLLGPGNETRERYADTQINHRMTPSTTLTMGLRISRARILNTLLGTTTSSRETGMRLSLSSMLSPRTQLVGGLRRQRTVISTSGEAITENVVFAGLEHRF